MALNPASVVCRKYNENFTIEINATNVINTEDFKFEIHYNTTLLDFTSVDWRAWGTGTVNADEANGNVTGYTSGSLKTGNLTLITLSFRVSYYHVWKDCPGWQNNLTGTIYIQWVNLSRLNGQDLRYEKGGMNDFTAPPPEVTYVFSPIQGDVNNDGMVDIFDLRTVAAYYDVKQGDTNWAEASTYNLKCGETPEIIDIYDLILVAIKYGTTYGS
jgi:hypothetical protein